MLKKLIKKTFNHLGFDIIRLPKSPQATLLGLRSRPIRTVIDVGANQGQFARYIREIFPQAHLYCFEPLPEPYQKLKAWAERQKAVTAFNVALGERETETEMFLHVDHSPSSSLLATTDLTTQLYPQTKRQEKVPVQLTTLDNLFHKLFPPPAEEILIKLDVQGYENRVIQGGKSVFSKANACLLEIALNNLYSEQASFKELFLLLDALQFRYIGNLSQIYSETGEVIYLDAIFSK